MKNFLFLSLSFFLLYSSAYSQIDSTIKKYRLSEVVITATKTNTSIDKIGSTITVIDSAEIQNSGKFSLYDILKNEFSVYTTQQGGAGRMSNISLRGDNPGHALVLLDGIKLNMSNDPSNVFDFANMNLDNIERIEILRGPQSTLYGSDALSGVVNIISKNPKSAPKFYLTGEGGSYHTYRYGVGSYGIINSFDYAVNFSRFKTDGFSSADEKFNNKEKDGADNYNASAKVGFAPSENTKTTITYFFSKASADMDQFGGPLGDDPTYKGKSEESFFKIDQSGKFFNDKLQSSLTFTQSRNIRRYEYDGIDFMTNLMAHSTSRYDGKDIRANIDNNINLNEYLNMLVGLEVQQEAAETEYYLGTYSSIFPSSKVNTYSVYLQNQFTVTKDAYATLGLRYDKHEKFGSYLSYRAALVYNFTQFGLRLKGSIGNGFKAPSLYYLYDPTYGNPNLKPEKNTGWDLGFEQHVSFINLQIGANYFHTDYTDLLGTDQIFKAINTGSAYINGVETFVNYQTFNNLSFKLNYTYLDSKDQTNYLDNLNNQLKKDKPLLKKPYNKVGISISYIPIENSSIYIEGIYTGKRDDIDFTLYPAVRVSLNDYFLLNANFSYKLSGNYNVYLRLENITNKDYEEVFGYGTSKRAVYCGAKITF